MLDDLIADSVLKNPINGADISGKGTVAHGIAPKQVEPADLGRCVTVLFGSHTKGDTPSADTKSVVTRQVGTPPETIRG
jgi:hypothetical protein